MQQRDRAVEGFGEVWAARREEVDRTNLLVTQSVMMLLLAERKRNETEDRRENHRRGAHRAPPFRDQIVYPIANEEYSQRREVSGSRSCHAPTASCPPSGKKYCVPLIGSVTFRSNSCKSSLRSTKSISDVLTISRSDDV